MTILPPADASPSEADPAGEDSHHLVLPEIGAAPGTRLGGATRILHDEVLAPVRALLGMGKP